MGPENVTLKERKLKYNETCQTMHGSTHKEYWLELRAVCCSLGQKLLPDRDVIDPKCLHWVYKGYSVWMDKRLSVYFNVDFMEERWTEADR